MQSELNPRDIYAILGASAIADGPEYYLTSIERKQKSRYRLSVQATYRSYKVEAQYLKITFNGLRDG